MNTNVECEIPRAIAIHRPLSIGPTRIWNIGDREPIDRSLVAMLVTAPHPPAPPPSAAVDRRPQRKGAEK
jgi:hypothetical protein